MPEKRNIWSLPDLWKGWGREVGSAPHASDKPETFQLLENAGLGPSKARMFPHGLKLWDGISGMWKQWLFNHHCQESWTHKFGGKNPYFSVYCKNLHIPVFFLQFLFLKFWPQIHRYLFLLEVKVNASQLCSEVLLTHGLSQCQLIFHFHDAKNKNNTRSQIFYPFLLPFSFHRWRSRVYFKPLK